MILWQGNRHIRANHASCHCLDSKPSAQRGYDYYAHRHEVGGFANASDELHPANVEFIDVGFFTILIAKTWIAKGSELFAFYNL
jgi:hypothetical protein